MEGSIQFLMSFEDFLEFLWCMREWSSRDRGLVDWKLRNGKERWLKLQMKWNYSLNGTLPYHLIIHCIIILIVSFFLSFLLSIPFYHFLWFLLVIIFRSLEEVEISDISLTVRHRFLDRMPYSFLGFHWCQRQTCQVFEPHCWTLSKKKLPQGSGMK